MIVASKGAAGVSGAGMVALAAGPQSHRPELLDGIGLIVGIDRFMSEARALTNFSGNAAATIVIGAWTNTLTRPHVGHPTARIRLANKHGRRPSVIASSRINELPRETRKLCSQVGAGETPARGSTVSRFASPP